MDATNSINRGQFPLFSHWITPTGQYRRPDLAAFIYDCRNGLGKLSDEAAENRALRTFATSQKATRVTIMRPFDGSPDRIPMIMS